MFICTKYLCLVVYLPIFVLYKTLMWIECTKLNFCKGTSCKISNNRNLCNRDRIKQYSKNNLCSVSLSFIEQNLSNVLFNCKFTTFCV